MKEVVELQTLHCSSIDRDKLCSFDREVIDGVTRPLIHQGARFLLINNGNGIIRIQGREYTLAPGTMVSILPWEISEITEVESPLQYYIVRYQFDAVNEVIKSSYNIVNEKLSTICPVTEQPVAVFSGQQLLQVQSIFDTLRLEVGVESVLEEETKRPLSRVYLMNMLIELTVLFIRGCQTAAPQPEKNEGPDKTEIFRYMYHHLSEKITLKSLSQVFYLSETTIRLYIREMTGLSFFDLLGEMRVGKTINFLLYTNLTMEELAQIVGYVDASHISKVFSARLGVKANEYRKTYQRVGEICKVRESRKAYAVVEYIYRNYAEPLTVQSVSKEFDMTVAELHRTLMYQVEANFESFLNFVRVSQACRLLLETNRSVTDIAMDVGYNTVKSFHRNFLRFQRMTPSKFREAAALEKI